MFNRMMFKLAYGPFIELITQVMIAFALMYVLLLKDCLEVLLWACQNLRQILIWILQTLCIKNSKVWTSFLIKVEKNFSEPFAIKFSNTEQNNAKNFESKIRTPKYHVQKNGEHINNGETMSQNCKINGGFLHFENLNRSPIYETPKYNVGTQTLIALEVPEQVQTPKRKSIISVFEIEENDSVEALNNFVKTSNIKKGISMKCNFSPPKCFNDVNLSADIGNNSSAENRNDLSFEDVPLEPENISQLLEKITRLPEKSPDNISQLLETINRSPEKSPEKSPGKTPENISQLLESPLCQINLESIENLRLRFSPDSPEEKSIFSKSLKNLKLKVNKCFLGLKKEDNCRLFTVEGNENKEDSELIGCCSFMCPQLKSKVDKKVNGSQVVYHKF